ncbi:hypothetical protein PIB30_034075 [Stylosanthes scabra]|uniref:TF-B3 domain-containing protein n=1 Tax=Stylosanthes scabra TaxID=79078 RepID=A0ABU6ZAA8_9FABA|nr:hypothetical protein [Stylosanthes scabra]
MASRSYQPNKHSPPPTLIRFFKIILRQNLQHGNLKIPSKFTSKYGGDVKNPVYLKPPDGTQWKVHWTQHDGEILFENGWKEFAEYYSLDHGHLLRFEYNGTSCFEVHIFDMSGLEIHYPFNNRIDDDSVEILNEPPLQCWGQQRKKLKTPLSLSLPSTSKQLRIVTETRDEDGGSQSEEKNTEMPVIPSVGRRSDVFEPGTCGFRCLEEAQKFNSENPSFIIKLRKINLQRSRTNFKASFYRKYFENKEQAVEIRYGGKLWPAKLLYYPVTAAYISNGWRPFRLDNDLKVGDVCVFELIINGENPVLDAHIYRANDYAIH